MHKPLLLLLALGRVQRGAKRLVPFRELEEPLVNLLRAYGPPSFAKRIHPEYPFWGLKSDGLWEVPGGSKLPFRKGGHCPTLEATKKVSGGLPRDVYDLLRKRDDVVQELGRILLDDHFVKQKHPQLLFEVRLKVAPALPPLLPAEEGGSDDTAVTAEDAPASADPSEALGSYAPSAEDTREIAQMAIKQRRGQREFRKELWNRYGTVCLVSGCDLPDVLEAAHINPFRGRHSNHPENGLLLRADLHTLFDLDLLGIHPDTLEVHLHPKVAAQGYGQFAGTRLICTTLRPSRAALELRWRDFQVRCKG